MKSSMTETAQELVARLDGCLASAISPDDIRQLHLELVALLDRNCDDQAELTAALAREAALREALEFYANPETYRPHPHGIAFDRRDISYIARAALSVTP